MLDIVGVGDANVDLMIRVDHIAGHDEKVRGKLIGKFCGGITANFCCAAAKYGARTGIITAVGDDEFGRMCVDDLIRFGVDTGGAVVVPDGETYFCVVLLDDTGEKALTIVETPILTPPISAVDEAYLAQARYCHLTSLNLELARHVTECLAGSKTVLSIDIEATAEGGLGEWERVIRGMGIVFINDFAIRRFFGADEIDSGAKELLKLGPDAVVVTRGAQGASVYANGESFTVPAFKVQVADTTGAGDCFNAVFIASLAQGCSLYEGAQRATAAAALAIQKVGTRTALPSRNEIDSYLASNVKRRE